MFEKLFVNTKIVIGEAALNFNCLLSRRLPKLPEKENYLCEFERLLITIWRRINNAEESNRNGCRNFTNNRGPELGAGRVAEYEFGGHDFFKHPGIIAKSINN